MMVDKKISIRKLFPYLIILLFLMVSFTHADLDLTDSQITYNTSPLTAITYNTTTGYLDFNGTMNFESIHNYGETASYVIFGEDTDSDGIMDIIYVKNGTTGKIDYTSTNATAVIQYAIDILNNKDGGIILLKSGEYLVRRITLYDNIIIKGSGIENTILKQNLSVAQQLDVDSDYSLVFKITGSNSSIEYMSIIFKDYATSWKVGIYISGNNNYIGHIRLKQEETAYPTSSRQAIGIDVRGDNNIICYSEILGTGDEYGGLYGICIQTPGENNKVVNNYIFGWGHNGIYTALSKNTSIISNIIDRVWNDGIDPNGDINMQISNNILLTTDGVNTSSFVSIEPYGSIATENVIISGNVIVADGIIGSIFQIRGFPSSGKGCVITDNNVFTSNEYVGYVLQLEYADNISFSNNIVRGNICYVMTMKESNNIVISDNIINIEKNWGIFARLYDNISNVFIKNNIIKSSTNLWFMYTTITPSSIVDFYVEGNKVNGNIYISSTIKPYITFSSNYGFTTENSDTATISAGSTSVVVSHGLAGTPTVILLTPAGNYTVWYDTVGSTSFTIHCYPTPSSDLTVSWEAIYKP